LQAVNRVQKEQIVEELKDRFSRSRITILTDYKGLDVDSINRLRTKLREIKTEYSVAKNTLMRMAAKDTKAQALESHFQGPRAIAISYEDPVAPAKVLVDFAKDNNNLEIISGLLEDKVISMKDIQELAKLPGKEILLGRLLSAMNAVPTGLVQVLAGIPRKLLYVLKAIEQEKSNNQTIKEEE